MEYAGEYLRERETLLIQPLCTSGALLASTRKKYITVSSFFFFLDINFNFGKQLI